MPQLRICRAMRVTFEIAGLVLTLALGSACARAAASDENVFAISDLHFGVGRDGSAWHPYEDFRWHDDFVRFLAALRARVPGGATLVLNGDTFELWQSTTNDCPLLSNRDLGCEEKAAKSRLERVLAQHKETIAALREFAEADGNKNKVVIVPGNHDAALLFGSVRDILVQKIGPKVQVVTDGYWLLGRKVLFEHGHQFDELNALKGWPKPFANSGGVEHLARPWGELFVLQIFDAQEKSYPVIDNVNDNSVGIDYYVQAEAKEAGGDPQKFWTRAGVRADSIRTFLGFAVLETSWRQLGRSLGGDNEPTWDVERINANADRDLLLAVVPDNMAVREAVRLAVQSGDIGWKDFSPEQIRDLCTAQAKRALDTHRTDLPMCDTVGGAALGDGDDPRSLGAAATQIFSTPRAVLSRYLRTRRDDLRRPGWNGEFAIYVYGHTHQVEAPFEAIEQGPWNPIAVNTGAWQRVASPQYLERRTPAAQPAYEMLRLTPEELAPCYSVVAIDTNRAKASVLFWREKDGAWGFDSTCPADPDLLVTTK